MAFFAKIDSFLTTVTSSGDGVCCKSGGADSNSTNKTPNSQSHLQFIYVWCFDEKKIITMILSKVGQKNNILSKYILKREDLLLKELTSICLKTHFKTCRQPDCNSIIVHSKCSLKRPHSEVPFFFFFFLKVQVINIPIQWSIIADSRDHDHSVGGELPHLSIKQKKMQRVSEGGKWHSPNGLHLITAFYFSVLGPQWGHTEDREHEEWLWLLQRHGCVLLSQLWLTHWSTYVIYKRRCEWAKALVKL